MAADNSTKNNWSVPVMLYFLRIGREDLKNRDRYPKEEIQAFALGVVVLKRFSVKEVVT